MQEVYVFAAGIGLGAVLMGGVLLPIILKAHKFLAYRNPADMVFYEYELTRLKGDRKKWWSVPLPSLKKKPPEPSAGQPTVGVSEDYAKQAMVSAVEAVKDSADYAKKVRTQQEQLRLQRQGQVVIP